jgi:hypothetical protein
MTEKTSYPKNKWLLPGRRNVVTVLAAVFFIIASEVICFSFGRLSLDKDFRIVYLTAFIEPVFAAFTLVPGFFILWERLFFNREKLHERNMVLQKALNERKELRGMLPICPVCKKVRNDAGYWVRIEEFVEVRSRARFTHSMCEECARGMLGEEEQK